MYKINHIAKGILVLIIILILLICSACTSKKVVPAIQNDPQDVFTEKQSKEETLTFYFPGDEPDGARKVLDKIEKQLKSTLNVKLDFKWIKKDAYLQQVKYKMDQGNPLDVFIASKEEVLEMAKDGKITDITPYFEKSTPKLYQMFSKEDLANVTSNDKILAVPQFTIGSTRICAVVREDILKKFHVTDIKSYEDFESLLGSIVEDDNYAPTVIEKTPLELFASFNGYVPLSDNLVYTANDSSINIVPWEQTPAFKVALETIERWKSKKYILNYNLETFTKSVYDGVTGLDFFSWGDSTASVLTDWDDAQNYIYFKGIQDPKVKVFPLYPDKTVAKPANITTIAISKQAKDPERILKFLEWVENSQVNYDLFMYGIEGQNYQLKDNKVDFPATMSKYYGWDGSEVFFNTKYVHPTASETDLLKSDENVVGANTAGFVPDTSVIQSFLDSRKENYEKLQDKIENDHIDIEKDIPAFISAQQSAGVDRITENLQKQLNEWKNSK